MSGDSHADRVISNIRAEMARHKRTQADLAPSVGMTQQSLSRRLSGRTPFNIDELSRIAAALEVPVTTLLSEVKASA